MIKGKRIWVGSIAVAGLLAACGGGGSDSDSSASPSEGGSDANIAAVIKGLDNPFFQAMEDGINAQAQDSGAQVEIQAATSITDTTGQAEKLTAMAQQDYNCFVVNPISGTNLVQALAPVAAIAKADHAVPAFPRFPEPPTWPRVCRDGGAGSECPARPQIGPAGGWKIPIPCQPLPKHTNPPTEATPA